MTEAQTILQCGMCHRQHDGGGTVLEFRFCTPEIVECGRPDCAAVVQELLSREAARRNAKAARRVECRAVQRAKPKRGGAAAPPYPRHAESQLPPSDRFDAEEAESFRAADEREKEALLDYANLTAVLDDFLRVKHFRVWHVNADLVKMLEEVTGKRVNNFNNVMSKLRARYEEEGLPLDVDTAPVTAQLWNVRVCPRAESVRLQGENPSRSQR